MNTQQQVDTAALRASYANAIGEAKKIAEQWKGKEDQMPAEAANQIQGWLGKSDEAKVRLQTFERLAEGEEFLSKPSAGPVSWREAAPDEGNVETDEKSWREFTIKNTASGDRTFRYNVPLATGRTAKQAKAYSAAHEAYLRYGREYVKSHYPNDAKALSEATDTAGGFLVPQDFHEQLIKKIAVQVVVRANANVVQTSRDVATWARVNYTTDNKYTSPARMTWTGEQPASSTAARITDQVFGQINIPVHVALATQPITNSMIEDGAFDILGYASDSLAEAFALGENDTFLNGSGVAQPFGLLTNVDGTYGITSVASGTSAQIFTAADAHNGKRLMDVYYNTPAQYRRTGMWLMNSLTLEAVDNLVDGQKRPIVKELNTSSMAMGEPGVIKARPIAVDEFVPDIAANAFPIIFGQMTGYTIVDRVGFSIQRLTELYAETDITLLVARKRVGGALTEPYRLRVMKCA